MKNVFFITFMLFLTAVKAQNNLGFESWNPNITFIPASKDMVLPECHPYILDKGEIIQAPGSTSDDMLLNDWSAIPHGILRTADSYSGKYAAVISMWYFGGKGILAYGKSPYVYTKIPKVQFSGKLYGISGHYKYIRDSIVAMDVVNKTALLNIATYQTDASGILTEISRDSLIFDLSDTYRPFLLPVTYPHSGMVADSVSIWFESKSYGGATSCERSHFLYLDDLEFHFTPLDLKEDTFKLKLKVYPNPATDVINLEYENDVNIKRIQLTDTAGKTIRLFNVHSKVLDVQNVTSGTYFLNIRTTRGNLSRKIIIR